MNKFQIILLVIFGFFILAAVLVFSLYKGASSSQYTVTIWGSLPATHINSLINSADFNQDKTLLIRYEQKSQEKLERDFTEALAQGNGPDLIILSQDALWQARKKLSLIPYSSISQRDFQSAFLDGADIFLSAEGAYALPLVVDPMVLYYNRDLLASAGIAQPLSYWDEIYADATRLTTEDEAGNITQTAIALGETKNVSHYKEILSLLLLQAGTPIADPDSFPKSLLSSSFAGQPIAPGVSAFDFFTQFANPSKPFYSWNKTLPEALNFFASGDSAYYLGFASEQALVKSKSPTLNFRLVSAPQSRVGMKKVTYGKIYSVALSRGSRNPSASLSVALKLVSSTSEKLLSTALNLAPARRDLLAKKPTDSTGPVIYEAALQSHSWIDPNAAQTSEIFREAVDSITSGRARTTEAVSKANDRLESLFNAQ